MNSELGMTNEQYKARLIVWGYKDIEKDFITHTSKTESYKNIRILLNIAELLDSEVWRQDVAQAYIKGYGMQRYVFVNPAPQYNL